MTTEQAQELFLQAIMPNDIEKAKELAYCGVHIELTYVFYQSCEFEKLESERKVKFSTIEWLFSLLELEQDAKRYYFIAAFHFNRLDVAKLFLEAGAQFSKYKLMELEKKRLLSIGVPKPLKK